MLTNETKRRLVIIGMFLVPVALVKGTAVFYGVGEPAGADAATIDVNPAATPVVSEDTTSWNASEQAAAQRIAELYQQPVGLSPLLHNAKPVDPRDTNVPVDPTAPNLLVQAILASPTGNTALINGKMYRVGDTFEGTDWRVSAIENDTRSVTLTNVNNGNELSRAVRIIEQ